MPMKKNAAFLLVTGRGTRPIENTTAVSVRTIRAFSSEKPCAHVRLQFAKILFLVYIRVIFKKIQNTWKHTGKRTK